jgi:hypothetical protein
MSKVRTGHEDVFIGKTYYLLNGIPVSDPIPENIIFIITYDGFPIIV